MEIRDKYKIESFAQDYIPGDSPEGPEGFLRRIENVAKTYAEQGWEIISLSFPCETEARLFLRKWVAK